MSLPMSQSTMGTPTRQGLPFPTMVAILVALAALTGYLLSLPLHGLASWAWPVIGALSTAASVALAVRQSRLLTRQLHDAQVVGVTGPLSQALEPGAPLNNKAVLRGPCRACACWRLRSNNQARPS